MQGWLVVLAGVAVFLYGVSPLIIYFSQRMKAHPQLTPVDVNRLPSEVWQYLYDGVGSLLSLGFQPIAYVAMPDPLPNVRTYLALLVNIATDDKAMVTAIFSTAGGTQNSTLYIEFSTRFVSGQGVDTMNSKTLNAFPADPSQLRVQVPCVMDPAEVYRLHTWVMEQHCAGESKQPYPVDEEPLAFLHRVLIEEYERQVRRKWLYLNRSDDAYRPTILGAYMMTWGLLWPVSMVRTLMLRARESRLLRQFRGARQPLSV